MGRTPGELSDGILGGGSEHGCDPSLAHELAELKLRAVFRRAEQVGAPEHLISVAEDAANPRAAAIELILRHCSESSDINPLVASQVDATPPHMIEFTVSTLTGKKIAVTASNGDSVESVKAQIHVTEGIPPQEQRLMMNGNELEADELAISHFNIVDGTELHLVLRLPPTAAELEEKRQARQAREASRQAELQIVHQTKAEVAAEAQRQIFARTRKQQRARYAAIGAAACVAVGLCVLFDVAGIGVPIIVVLGSVVLYWQDPAAFKHALAENSVVVALEAGLRAHPCLIGCGGFVLLLCLLIYWLLPEPPEWMTLCAHGELDASGTCICEPGYAGEHCELDANSGLECCDTYCAADERYYNGYCEDKDEYA